MSLLLDALKKAADDKQKTAQNGSEEPATRLPDTDEPGPINEKAVTEPDWLKILSHHYIQYHVMCMTIKDTIVSLMAMRQCKSLFTFGYT